MAGKRSKKSAEVPDQAVEARLVIEPASLRRGETFTATLRNDGPTAVMTGTYFALERFGDGTWEYVDPFDGESVAWPAVGLVVRPGGSREFRVVVPRLTQLGQHRMIKTVSAARVDEMRVVAEFDVTE